MGPVETKKPLAFGAVLWLLVAMVIGGFFVRHVTREYFPPSVPKGKSKVELLTEQLRSGKYYFNILCELKPQPRATIRYPDLNVPMIAAQCLGEMGPAASQAVPDLIRRLEDVEEFNSGDGVYAFRSQVAWALGQIHDERAIEPLIRTLSSSHLAAKGAAAAALGQFGPRAKEAVPLIVPLLTTKTPYDSVAKAAGYALGEIRDARAIPPLIEALKNGPITSGAVCALAEFGPAASDAADVVRPLVKYKAGQKDLEPYKVRECAEKFLVAIKR